MSKQLFIEDTVAQRGFQLRVIHNNQQADCAVILIHGAGGRADQWRPMLEVTRLPAHVVAMDLLGHGGSAQPDLTSTHNPYQFHLLVDDLVALCQSGPHTAYLFVAHSLGGPLALAAIERLQAQNKGLQMALCLLAPILPQPMAYHRLAPWMPVWLLERLRGRIGAAFQRHAYHPKTEDALKQQEAKITDLNAMSVVKGIWQGSARMHPPSSKLDLVHALLILGQADRIIANSRVKTYYQTALGCDCVTMQNVGHMMQLESPQLLGQLIAVCLQRLVISMK